ncbi:MAG TPA: flagellar protein [Betaproteobacteria bacterium]|nr:flagellar protein [Betaproteobacteria bacterium]
MAIDQIGNLSQPLAAQADPALRQATANVVPLPADRSGGAAAGALLQSPVSRPAAKPPVPAHSAEAGKNGQTAAKQHGDGGVDATKLHDAVKSANQFLQAMSRNLSFSIDKDTGKTVVKVVDDTTKEVIRQIPSAEMLAISKALDKLQGLLIKEHA